MTSIIESSCSGEESRSSETLRKSLSLTCIGIAPALHFNSIILCYADKFVDTDCLPGLVIFNKTATLEQELNKRVEIIKLEGYVVNARVYVTIICGENFD
jgi:hypothetical protein